MRPAIEVAACLLQLARGEPEPTYLTHLQLQKLLYYVQGWSIGLRGTPLFDGRIEAWKHGPVVVEVCPFFAAYSKAPIIDWQPDYPADLPQDEKFFVRLVWEAYKGLSAVGLYEKTHCEPPWQNARGDLKPAERGTREITHDALRAYFSSCVAERPDAAFQGFPDWSASDSDSFVEAAQKVFARNAMLLRRLAS